MRESSSLYYMRARYYDGGSGRFLSRDPVGVDLADPKSTNPYQYAAQNPLRYIDPLGLQGGRLMMERDDRPIGPTVNMSEIFREVLAEGEEMDTGFVPGPNGEYDETVGAFNDALLDGFVTTKNLRFTVEGLSIEQQCFARRGTSPGTCVSADFWDTFWIGATAGAKLAGIDLEGSFIYGQRRLWSPMWDTPKFEQPGFGTSFTAQLPLEPAPIWLFSDTVPPDRGKGSSRPPDTADDGWAISRDVLLHGLRNAAW